MEKKRFWGEVGKTYDLITEAIPHYKRMQNKIWKLLKEQLVHNKAKTIPVLELWCGTGYTSKIILDTDPRIKLRAIDNEESMLKQAEEKLAKYVISDRVKFIKWDILEVLLNQRWNKYAAVVSAETIHNIDRSKRSRLYNDILYALDYSWIFINCDKYAIDDEKKHAASLARQIDKFIKMPSDKRSNELKLSWISHYLRDNKKDLIMKEKEAINDLEQEWFLYIQVEFREQMEAILTAYRKHDNRICM